MTSPSTGSRDIDILRSLTMLIRHASDRWLGVALALVLTSCSGSTDTAPATAPEGSGTAKVSSSAHPGAANRVEARRRIRELGREATDELLLLLKSPDAELRIAAASALGGGQDPTAVPALLDAALDDPSASVRQRAVWALTRTDTTTPDDLVRDRLRIAIKDNDEVVRWHATLAAVHFDLPEALPELKRALGGDDEQRLREAIFVLGRAGRASYPDAIPLLVDLAKNANARIRRDAVAALGRAAGGPRTGGRAANSNPVARAALIEALDDQRPDVRGAAAIALGTTNNDDARVALERRRSKETDERVRQLLARSLDEVTR